MEKMIPKVVSRQSADDNDEELVEQARQDLDAFAHLYDRYLPLVYRYLYSKLSDTAEAEDLTSQVFLAALEAFPRYRHSGSFGAWLLGIARRKAAAYYRKRVHQAELEEDWGVSPTTDPILAQIVHMEELQRLAGLVAGLDNEQQELVRLRFGARLGFAEIAAVMKRKESAVKMALYRLMERLQKQLEAKNE